MKLPPPPHNQKEVEEKVCAFVVCLFCVLALPFSLSLSVLTDGDTIRSVEEDFIFDGRRSLILWGREEGRVFVHIVSRYV